MLKNDKKRAARVGKKSSAYHCGVKRVIKPGGLNAKNRTLGLVAPSKRVWLVQAFQTGQFVNTEGHCCVDPTLKNNVSGVARKFGVNRNTVRKWLNAYRNGDGFEDRPRPGRQKIDRLLSLVSSQKPTI